MIGKALTKYAFKHKHRWDEYLDIAVWATRVRQHSVTKHSPFYLVHGTEPQLLSDTQPPAVPEKHTDLVDQYNKRVKKFSDLKGARHAAFEAQVAAAYRVEDQYRQLGEANRFLVDDWVMMQNMRKQKLDPDYYGPFFIVQQAPFFTYKLALPNGEEVPELVHNNRLRRCTTGELIPKIMWAHTFSKLKQQTTTEQGA